MTQYLQDIYRQVFGVYSPPMTQKEHWRQRLLELFSQTKLSQAAFSTLCDIPPNYLSRLLYPPDKAGKKSLGPVVIGKISEKCGLPPGWFDMPLGTPVPGTSWQTSAEPAATMGEVNDSAAAVYLSGPPWPFEKSTYARVARVRRHFDKPGMPDAIKQMDEYLDIMLMRWEADIDAAEREPSGAEKSA